MMLPFDPIMMLVVVVGAFAYFALKSSVSQKKKTMSNEEFVKWFREKEIERSPENVRYQNWLYNHRQE